MTGRALAVVADLAADLQPAGWRLTGPGGSTGMDQRRARSQLGQDLDQLEEQLQDYRGPLKVQVCGPWTLAATVERPRGDKVLADHGDATRPRAGPGRGAAEPPGRRPSPGARRRPAGASRSTSRPSAAVLGARVPTASGFGRHRAVDRPELSQHLEWVLAAATEHGEPWVHSCAADVPLDVVRGAGARGALGRPRGAGPRRPRRARRGARGRGDRRARRRTLPRPRYAAHRPAR